MPRSDESFVLVVRVWFHEGVPVARQLAHPSACLRLEGENTVAGRVQIITAMERGVTNLVSALGGDSDPA